MKSGGCGFRDKRQGISWGSNKSFLWFQPRRDVKVALPALLALVDVGVKVDIGDVAVKHTSSSLNHAIRKLGADAHCVSKAF
jgi:hypothetical protein